MSKEEILKEFKKKFWPEYRGSEVTIPLPTIQDLTDFLDKALDTMGDETLGGFVDYIYTTKNKKALGFMGKLAWADVRDSLSKLANEYKSNLKTKPKETKE